MVTLAPIAIAATSQQYLVSIVENLCQPVCATSGTQPTGSVNFTVASIQNNNTQTIVTINAAVTVVYTPTGSCKSVVKQYVEQFQVAFIGAAGQTPTIALTPLNTEIDSVNVKCCNRAYGVSLATPLTIDATFPAA